MKVNGTDIQILRREVNTLAGYTAEEQQ